MTEKSKSLIGGISILGLAGMICKVVGVLYRIPLADSIGGDGLGVYSKVFSAYNMLLTIASVGIPVAISRMVSHYVTRGDGRSAHRVFSVAAPALGILGLIGTLVLLLGSGYLSQRVGTPETRLGYIAIAPSVVLVCVMGAFRGYMQGHRRMLPTAISQLIEQVGKVFVALPLAALGMLRGGPGMGAAGALLGTSMAEAVALAYMIFAHMRARAGFDAAPQAVEQSASRRVIGRNLAVIAVPITLGSCIVPLASLIDSFMVTRLMENGGMAADEALVRYGLYSGMVLPLINVPTALAMAMSTNLVPAISAGLARGDTALVSNESRTGMRVAAVVGFPCSIGMSLLARPILYLCYGYSGRYTPLQLDIAAELLTVSAMTIILFTMVQATTGILQGCGKQRIPTYTLLAGVICKVALNFTLIAMPSINIHGAPIASLVCYTVSMVPNLIFTVKYAAGGMPWREIVLRPLAAALPMGAVVWVLWHFIFTDTCLHAGRMKLLLGVMVCVGIGVIVYVLLAVAVGAVKREDLPARIRRLIPRRIGK